MGLVATEYQECLAFYQWAQLQPRVGEYLIKNVNEGKRTVRAGYALRAIGLRAGVPDYFLPVPNLRYQGLWLEMKRTDRKGGARDPRQDAWIAKLNAIGHYAVYVYGWEHAAQVVVQYLNNEL